MNLDKATLMRFESRGEKVGTWHGKNVFACSSVNLESKGSGAYYILYDDDNKLVGKDGKYYYSYGVVSNEGSVDEYNSRRRYNVVCEKEHDHGDYKKEAKASTYTPGYDMSERPTGDVSMEIDVEAVLKSAREMSIEQLLDGFMTEVMAKG